MTDAYSIVNKNLCLLDAGFAGRMIAAVYSSNDVSLLVQEFTFA